VQSIESERLTTEVTENTEGKHEFELNAESAELNTICFPLAFLRDLCAQTCDSNLSVFPPCTL